MTSSTRNTKWVNCRAFFHVSTVGTRLVRIHLETQKQGRIQGVSTVSGHPPFLIKVPFFEKNSVTKYDQECIKTHHFAIRNTKIFCGGGTAPSPDLIPSAPWALDLQCPFQMVWTPALVKFLIRPWEVIIQNKVAPFLWTTVQCLHQSYCSNNWIIHAVGYLVTTLLQIVHRICHLVSKNFQNQSILGKDMDNDKVGSFFEMQGICAMQCTARQIAS